MTNRTVVRACRTILAVWVLAALVIGLVALDRQAMNDEREDREDEAAAETTTAPTAWQTTNLPPPLTEPAVTSAQTTAVRDTVQIQTTPPPTPPPFDPVAYVNGLAYCWQCPAPAMEAYRVVATYYGWAEGTINGRATFVQRIMAGESAFCWNARRWTTGTALLMPCGDTNPGVHDDVGFGQITNVLRPLTCEKAGLCDIASTVASPWNSMLAYVVVLDELGKRPWCYLNNTHIRNGDCATWPG